MLATRWAWLFLLASFVAPAAVAAGEGVIPTPVAVIEAGEAGLIWQSITDVLWVHGQLYLVDNVLSRVEVVSADGEYLFQLAGEGDGPGDVRNPTCIALDSDGHLVVCSQWFGKCEVFDASSHELIRSFSLHMAESDDVCLVVRVAWASGFRFEHQIWQRIDGVTVVEETRLVRYGRSDDQIVLFEKQVKRDWRTFNELDQVSFSRFGWAADGEGALWVAEEWEKPIVTNLVTSHQLAVASYSPCARTSGDLLAIRSELGAAGGIEEFDLHPTRRAIVAIRWDGGLRVLGESSSSCSGDSFVLCGADVPGGEQLIQAPIRGQSEKIFLLDDSLLAFVYSEAGDFETVWGEAIAGPCIVVVRYNM